MNWHYTAPYILNPQHPITVNVIGAGGNGSQTLTQLARMDQALKKLTHVGLHVTCWDDDVVSEANMARQLFSAADVGMNKASVLITRLNQYFGTSWSAQPRKFTRKVKKQDRSANITISCVDSIEARKDIEVCVLGADRMGYTREGDDLEPYQHKYYWIDLGNTQHTGQFVIGTCRPITQPKREKKTDKAFVDRLPSVFHAFPAFRNQRSKKTGPSCSLAEALDKQDLFINSFLVQTAMSTLWKMFREGKINYHGAFINLKTLDIAPIYL